MMAGVGEENDMTQASEQWQAFAADLAKVGARIHDRTDASRTAAQQGEVNEALLAGLFAALVALPHLDRDHPDWVPLINSAMRRYNPSPDTVYSIAYLSGSGAYRIFGRRNSVLMVHLQLMAGDPGSPGKVPLLSDINLNDCKIEADGTFEIILSASRPDGFDGNWFPVPPGHDKLFILARQIAYDWLNEVDAQMSIQRIDRDIDRPRPNPEHFDAGMREIPDYVNGALTAMANVMDVQLGSGCPVNELQEVSSTLPTITDQAYTHGLLDIAPDQAWIAECEIPTTAPYWSVQLMDYFYNAIDFMYRQSGLNGHQAQVDPDGKVRIVVCELDPGVANWLDKSGYELNQIRFRWFGSAHPHITTRIVPFDELMEHLPPHCKTVTPAERQAALRDRATGVQLRQRW